ncbi:MAG: PKD domain-containing protein [Saprospiraceae bacterium]|nr:PKD domain-containing protein [Saprospiraceae bacterium]MDW8230092.1 PKD domain-containing protein [Saprospiraceae bacterium]
MLPFNRLIPALVASFVFYSGLPAQNTAVSISGPTTVCPGCYKYRVVVTAPGGSSIVVGGYQWIQASANGATIAVSNDSTPTFCFYQSGIYKVFVSIVSLNGSLLGTSTIEVRVLPFTEVKLVSSNISLCASPDSVDAVDAKVCDRVCPKSTVTYSIEKPPLIGSPPNITWSVIGADSFRIHQPHRTAVTVHWGASGAGYVSAVVFSNSQPPCVGEAGLCVTIVEEPRAAFDVSPPPAAGSDTVRICKGQTVWFDNRSQNADRYEWFFSDDLLVSRTVNAQHTFTKPGVYTVRLIATTGCLCTDTTEAVVEVLDAESPTLDCVGDLCAGTTATYRAAANCSGIQWSISPNGSVLGGGVPGADSIAIRWNTGPVGAIWLSPQACAGAACPFPTLVRIPIIDDNAQIQGRERVCPNAEEAYSIEAYGGTGFVWTLSSGGTIMEGQGTSRIVVRWGGSANPNAVHRLSVRYDNCYLECGGQDTIEVRILSPFFLNGPVEVCAGTSGSFLSRLTVNNQNLSSHWTLLGPNGSPVWTSPGPSASVLAPLNAGAGYYRMRAVPANPAQTCTDAREWGVRVPTPPAVPTGIRGPAVICPGQTLTYAAEGVPAGATVRWTVQNGPGAPQTLLGNPINITWQPNGPYQLSAQTLSNDGLGCLSASATLNVQALSGATLSGPDTLCVGETAQYELPGLSGLNIQWSVQPADAGVITAGQGTNRVTVYWPRGGIHALRASACSQTAAFSVTVSPPSPATVQHPTALCAGETAVVRTAQTYSNYQWRNANQQMLSTADTARLGPGHYTVEAYDADGCPIKASFSIAQRETPYVTLSTNDPTAFCAPQNVTLQAVVHSGGGLTYEWFRNGATVGGNSPTFTTNQFGQYTVRVTNAAGCSATAGPLAIVQDCGGGGGGAPIPGSAPPCTPGQVAIQILPTGRCDSVGFRAIGPDYLPGSAQWRFFQWGKGIFAADSGDVVHRVFPEVGFQNALLIARTISTGQVCFLYEPFAVEAVARFSAPAACAGASVLFKEESSYLPSSGITAWSWNFGDPGSGANNTSNLREPSHVFANGGAYAVKLTITANSGCTATASRNIEVRQPAQPLVSTPNSGCADNALLFEGNGENLTWDFGDPASGALNTATGSPAYHRFSPGAYTVTAIATDNFGCTATKTSVVNVVANTHSGNIAPANPAPLCEGGTLTLTAPAGGVAYLWSDSSQANTLVVTQEGVYRVTLTDANGCTYAPPPVPVRFVPGPDALIKAAIINELGQTIGLAYPSHSVCAGDDVYLIAQGQGNLTFTWSTGVTGTRIEFSEQRNNRLPVGVHLYTVTVTDLTTGCTSVSPPFVVNVNPVPSGFSIGNLASPPCAGTTNTLTYNGPNPGNWQFVWNTGHKGVPLTTTQPGRYFLRVINEFGCEARSNPVVILPGPQVSAVPAGCHTRCRPDTLCAPNIPGITAWQWFLNGNPLPGATSPNLVPTQSGTYHAVLTDIFGCTNRSRPLTLNLYNGFGAVLGRVWADVNGNGIVDAGDTLVSGVLVRLWQGGTAVGSGLSGANGAFAFANVPAGGYTAAIDTSALPPGWKVVIGQASANLVGCDAATQVALLLRQTCVGAYTTGIQLSACTGETLLFNGTPIPAGGSHTFAYVTADGCDSLVTVTVSEIPATSGTLNVSACAGRSYDYNGTLIPAGSSRTFTLQNAAGCDSVLTVNVAALPATLGTLNVSACAGKSYDYNGTLIPAGSSQTFTLQNAAGCDSVLTVNVAALPATAGTLNVSACAGKSYNYNGTLIPAGSSQTFTLQNAAGCDSVLTVNVAAIPAASSTLRAGACPGQSFVYQGVALPIGAVRDFVLTSSQGCDSVVTVVVSALPTSVDTLRVRVCPDEVFSFNSTAVRAGETRRFAFINSAGCDSIVVVQVLAYPSATFAVQAQASCANSSTGGLTVSQPSGGLPPYQYSLDGKTFQSDLRFLNLPPGPYVLRLRDANGCVFEQPAEVPALAPLSVALGNGALLPCSAEGVVLAPAVSGTLTGLAYQWSTGAQTPQIEVFEPGIYTVEISNICERVRREVRVRWDRERPDVEFFYMPNVFAPESGDADNSQFRPYFAPNLSLSNYRFEIYDRWGNLMFRTQDPQEGWRGPFRSTPMQPAVFVWHVSADVNYCGRVRRVLRMGDVTIVR